MSACSVFIEDPEKHANIKHLYLCHIKSHSNRTQRTEQCEEKSSEEIKQWLIWNKLQPITVSQCFQFLSDFIVTFIIKA